MNIPGEKCERLLVFEQILQAHLIVHDGLQAFDAPGLIKFKQQFLGLLVLTRVALCPILNRF